MRVKTSFTEMAKITRQLTLFYFGEIQRIIYLAILGFGPFKKKIKKKPKQTACENSY